MIEIKSKEEKTCKNCRFNNVICCKIQEVLENSGSYLIQPKMKDMRYCLPQIEYVKIIKCSRWRKKRLNNE